MTAPEHLSVLVIVRFPVVPRMDMIVCGAGEVQVVVRVIVRPCFAVIREAMRVVVRVAV